MQLTYKAVFANILKRPAKTFGTIYAYDLYRYEYLLLILNGIAIVLNLVMFDLANIDQPLMLSLVKFIVKGAIVGVFWSGIISYVIYWAGEWLKGRAYKADIINVYAYASLPSLITLSVTMVAIILLRTNGYNGPHYPHNWTHLFYVVIRMKFYIVTAASIYQLVLLIIGVSVAQGFSYFKAFLNILIAVVLIAAPWALLIGFMVLSPAGIYC